MQTVPSSVKRLPVANFGSLNYQLNQEMAPVQQQTLPRGGSRWSKHSLSFPTPKPQEQKTQQQPEQHESITIASPPQPVARKSRTSRFRNAAKSSRETKEASTKHEEITNKEVKETPATSNNTTAQTVSTEEKPSVTSAPLPKVSEEKKARRQLRPRKALITLSPGAVSHLRALIDQPEPQLIRIGVRNRGCSGLTYHLEYVTKPGKFDELVEQDGVKVLIDSKALFSIVGSEMDWIDDKLSSRFIFKNPNSKGTCGCGESFMV